MLKSNLQSNPLDEDLYKKSLDRQVNKLEAALKIKVG